MAKFLVIYRSPLSPEEQMANATPEQAEAGMRAWGEWADRAGSAIVDLGSPLTAAGSVGAGSNAPAGSAGYVGGFSVLQADSADACRQVLADQPHLMVEGAGIEIYQFLELPDPS